MLASRWIDRFLVGTAAVSLFGACASGVGTSSSPSPGVTPTASLQGSPASVGRATVAPTLPPTATNTATAPTTITPAATATAVAGPTAIAYGPVAVVSGVESCTIDWGTISGEGTTVQHARNGTYECVDTVNDPRVNGTATATWNVDYWGTPDHMKGAYVAWGTARLATAGGAWEGRATSVYSSDRGDTIVWWWTGTDQYAGLAYFELVTGSGTAKRVQGQIFPGSPPDPSSVALPAVPPKATPGYIPLPTGTPEAIEYGPVSVFSGKEDCDMSHVFGTITTLGAGHTLSSNGTVKCTDTVNDPRMDGNAAGTWNMEHWDGPGNGALIQWGASQLLAGGSAWQGRSTGIYSADRGDIYASWWTGTGKYAGLAAFELATGSGPWHIQGQIFPGSPPQP